MTDTIRTTVPMVAPDYPRYDGLSRAGNNKRSAARPESFRVVATTTEVVRPCRTPSTPAGGSRSAVAVTASRTSPATPKCRWWSTSARCARSRTNRSATR